MSDPRSKVYIRGIPIDNIDLAETVNLLLAWAAGGSGGYVCTPNVDHVVRASRDPDFLQAILGARLRVPDGMGIVYGSRILGTPLRSTVTGRLLPLAVARRAASSGIALGFVGGVPGAAERASERLSALTEVDVAVAASPPMGFRIGSREDDRLLADLAGSRARLLFVGLGAPKQELWMARHAEALDGCVLVGVGQAIDVLSGYRPEAPAWATKVGAEWLFRLIREPRRLGRRYLVDDPRFFWWMVHDRLRQGGQRA